MQLFVFFTILVVLALAAQDTGVRKVVDGSFTSYRRCASDSLSEDVSCAVSSNVTLFKSVMIF
jgi:hypothetical protein